jgi:hypothetical protein
LRRSVTTDSKTFGAPTRNPFLKPTATLPCVLHGETTRDSNQALIPWECEPSRIEPRKPYRVKIREKTLEIESVDDRDSPFLSIDEDLVGASI